MPDTLTEASSDERARARSAWVCHALQDSTARIDEASSDASFRSYWRVHSGDATYIVMDAPPGLEDVDTWLDMCRRLREAGLHAPRVFARQAELGFVLIEDFGSRHYLDALDADSADTLYAQACHALQRMQTRVDTGAMQAYDGTFLRRELALMPEWFLGRHLGHTLTRTECHVVDSAIRRLVDAILEQPVCFVHRDFHSRNLLITEHDSPGIIDFQGALVGPVTYDLVSLLRDCYIDWPQHRVRAWALEYHQHLQACGRLAEDVDAARFLRWFDLTGAQRHLKVLGIFCRLAYRDGKRHYLDDLPRVFGYVLDVASRHDELAALGTLLRAAAAGRDLKQPRTA